MLDTLIIDPLSYFSGRLYRSAEDREGEPFEYAREDQQRREMVQYLRNIGIEAGTLLIRTTWALGYAPGMYVLLADGNRYYITAVAEDVTAANPQSLAFMSINPATDYYLSLRIVENIGGREV